MLSGLAILAGCEINLGSTQIVPTPEPPPVAVPEPQPPPEPAPPLPEPEFAPDRTYAVLETGAGQSAARIYALCDVTVLRRYRLRYNRQNWPTCSSRELLIGIARSEDTGQGTEATLDDGRRIRIWEIFDLATGTEAAPLPGRYVMAALSREADTIEVLTGKAPVYRIEPGRIHYLGRADTDGAVTARDVTGFARAFHARFPDIGRRRLETSPAEGLEVSCKAGPGSTDAQITGFDCLGKRLRGRFFR